jgi:hypothetical protein
MIPPSNPVLHLYKNNHIPSESTVIGSLMENTETGYAPVTLIASSWTTTSLSGVSTAVYSAQTFVFGTAATIYGYYVTNLSGSLLWVEQFSSGSFVLPAGGGSISIVAKLEAS